MPVSVVICGRVTLRRAKKKFIFIARQRAMQAERDIVMANSSSVCPSLSLSVPLSVCLSNAGIVSKRMDISSYFLTFW